MAVLLEATFFAACFFWATRGAVFFTAGLAVFFAAPDFCARTTAQRFFKAAIMRFRPSALSLRFFGATTAGARLALLSAAHLFRCAAAILFRAAGLRVRLAGAGVSP